MITIYILTIASGRVDIHELTPVLSGGFGPVLKASYPVVISFPFCEPFIFMQIWPFSESKESIRKITLLTLTISGFILTATSILIICVLGVNFAGSSTIPLLEVVKLINIADIITSLDAVGAMLIFIGGFYMAAFRMLAAAMILAELFKRQDYKIFLIPIGFFILWYAGVYEKNYPEHVRYLNLQFIQQFVPLYNIVPILLLLIFWLKKSKYRTISKESHKEG
jgi:spore germination protein KB